MSGARLPETTHPRTGRTIRPSGGGFVLIVVLVLAGVLFLLMSMATAAQYQLRRHNLARAARAQREAAGMAR
ncbi:MAG: hypothetical protein FJ225_04315 [Lentisphaerae bacterium]|nr:hypothetical protein [Lentisphaerota bacterium]